MMIKAKTATVLDQKIGSRVKVHRNFRGITQMALASALGITFQQVQKYERGTNRISASRLQQIADVLGTSVAGLTAGRDHAETDAEEFFNLLQARGAVETLRAWNALDPSLRKSFTSLMKAAGIPE